MNRFNNRTDKVSFLRVAVTDLIPLMILQEEDNYIKR